MTRWRKRVGEASAEEFPRETVLADLRLNLIKPSQLQRLDIGTTVQEKNVRFPTNARVPNRARDRLVKQAQAHGIGLRRSFIRVGEHELLMQSRHAHAKQFKRVRKPTKKLKTILARVIRDVERKATNPSSELQELLVVRKQILGQERESKNKVHGVHEPDVECISEGKAHKRCEFGCKVSLAATSKGGWPLAARPGASRQFLRRAHLYSHSGTARPLGGYRAGAGVRRHGSPRARLRGNERRVRG